MTARPACPVCGAADALPFHRVAGVPVHSVRLLHSRDDAVGIDRGDIDLAACGDCGFAWNRVFDPARIDYSPGYEPTQAFSPAFNRFHRGLAERLIDRHGVRGRTVVEIGCGQGEFLSLLCDLGGNRGIGYDPAYVRRDDTGIESTRVAIVQDVFSDANAPADGDFFCCKMTLEHLADLRGLLGTVRRAIAGRDEAQVFLQVPDATRIFSDIAFWDIYYEHCNYFDPASLDRLLRLSGFAVVDWDRAFGDQYLTMTARQSTDAVSAPASAHATAVERFRRTFPKLAESWRAWLSESHRAGRRVVLWGAGSKAVAFLTTLGVGEEVAFAIDVNPRKHGTYLAGTGHEIAAPARAAEERPDAVIVMNPMYRAEIAADLIGRGVRTQLLAVDAPPMPFCAGAP